MIAGVEPRAFDEFLQRLRQAREFFCERPELRMIRQLHERFETDLFLESRLLRGGVAAVLQQVMVQINFHRTRLGARPTERTRVGKMLPIL